MKYFQKFSFSVKVRTEKVRLLDAKILLTDFIHLGRFFGEFQWTAGSSLESNLIAKNSFDVRKLPSFWYCHFSSSVLSLSLVSPLTLFYTCYKLESLRVKKLWERSFRPIRAVPLLSYYQSSADRGIFLIRYLPSLRDIGPVNKAIFQHLSSKIQY